MVANPASPAAPAPNPSGGAPGEAPGRAPLDVAAPEDLDLGALEEEARRLIGERAYAYFAGGVEAERLLADNVAAWSRWRLHPRVLVDVARISTATTLLGTPVRSPIVVAPTAMQQMAHPEGEVATARAAAATGHAMVLSSVSNATLEDVAAAARGALRWMQVYIMRDRGCTEWMVERAAAAGYGALVLTVDAAVAGLRWREMRADVHLPADLGLPNLVESSSESAHEGGFMAVVGREFDPGITFDDISWLAGVSGLPVVVKGVLRADDALRCLEAGAAAVVVSNHGARQLDDDPATADVLAEILDAVGGRAEVHVDGGIRRAADAAKALALGARAVWVGRPVLWALATGGDRGVAELLAWFTAELARVMALCGAPAIADLDPSLVRPGAGQ
jgi:isopentenyl diphosphate isomerase/L-lactate dehydrogenase-like FMN-dependent dehydrogenase